MFAETPVKAAARLTYFFYLFSDWLVFCGFVIFYNLSKNRAGKSKRNMSVVGRIVFALKLSKFAASPHAFETKRQ